MPPNPQKPYCDTDPRVCRGNEPSVLTSIYQDNINISIWQRKHRLILDSYANAWAELHPFQRIKQLLAIDDLDSLGKALPDLEGKEAFAQDIHLLVDMFACLFDAAEVGIRLTPLAKAMCPRFHVDNIPCRLVATYGGPGTQWLKEDNLARQRLGKGASALSDECSGIYHDAKAIEQLSSQQIALLKGSGWQGNENYGLVHRSPCLPHGQTRLLLTLDF